MALAQGFDLVSIVKSPSLSLYQRLRRLRRPRVLMDINDALWLQKNGDWAELDAMLREVDAVICENNYLSNYATRFNPRTFVIDDAPQLEVFDRWRAKIRRSPEEIVVGWIGGQSNIGPLFKILEPLEALSIRYPQLRLRVVGAPESALPPFERVRASCLPTYSQEQMVREILKFDIGLFPLFHNEDGRARGTLKAKVYMSGEAVAVCENYGENPGLIEDGYNGFLATSPQDWYERLDWLITHPSERATIAERGLQVMRRSYTAERVFQRLLDAFDQTLTV
ncbi:MAG: glycosyltransferase [Candidatus Binatia bacterium]